MSPCARCGFELSDRATKCLFCGHVVGAALPPSAGPPAAGPAPSPDPGGRIPKPTIPYRRPDDLDVEAASTPPSSPLRRPGFGPEAATPAAAPAPAVPVASSAPMAPMAPAAPTPAVDAAVTAAPPVATAPAAPRGSMVTTLVIAVLVGAIAGGIGFLIFIALRG